MFGVPFAAAADCCSWMEVSMLPQPKMAVPSSLPDVDYDDRTDVLQLNSTIVTKEQYTKYYGSGDYDRRYPSANHFTLKAIRSALEEIHSKSAPTKKILDFGCGSGRYTIPLASHCKTIVAYDPCPEAINLLKRRSQQNIMPSQDLRDVLC